MKRSRIITAVPFKVVEHGTPFRFKNKWWKKKIGFTNWAYVIDNQKIHQEIKENMVVGIDKQNLRKREHYQIVKEVKVYV